MALGGCGRGPPVALLDQLLEEINFQRTKEMRQLLKDEGGFVVLQGTTQWTDLFVRHFLFAEETARAIDCDDLLFFVRKRHIQTHAFASASASCRQPPKYETVVEVFRKDSKKLPVGDPEIEWEETVYLNLIVHQFEYTLTLAVCTRTSPKELQVLRRHSAKVYASPSRRRMDAKGEGEEITYPHICFCVDNFDEVFSEMVVRDGEMVCVELCARGRGRGARAGAALFLGSVRYDALARAYDSRQASLSAKVAQRVSFGLLGRAARCELLRMRGPHGKGHAELAVCRPRGVGGGGGGGGGGGSGCDTPMSEPGGLSCADLWDSDWEDEPDDMMAYRQQRRLSDPLANIAAFARGGGGGGSRGTAGGAGGERCRSQQEGLDALADPAQPEVQAGDVRDARARARRRSVSVSVAGSGEEGEGQGAGAGCCACVPPARTRAQDKDTMRDVYSPALHVQYGSPACLSRGCPTAAALAHGGDMEGAEEAAEAAEGGAAGVRGVEELPARREYRPLRPRQTQSPPKPRPNSVPPGPPRAPPAPPSRTTPDGTTVRYWCDLTRPHTHRHRHRHRHHHRHRHELDDGAYNPLWGVRGFPQAFALWKEGRRAACAPLAAALTYLTLPWWAIAKDVLDIREEPILTF